MTRRALSLIVGVIIAVLVAGGATLAVSLTGGTPTRTITATFAETPGLYVGNHVDVLDIPVGTVTGIQPGPTGVRVTMQVEDSVKVPASARAVLMAPQVVNDRFVELDPAYSGGPAMPAGAHIPESRTLEPLSVDEILASLNSLLTALGPSAASQKGLLGTLVDRLDSLIGGQGANLHHTIDSTSRAVSALAGDSPQMVATLRKLSSLIGSLAADAGNYQSFTDTLATATADLSGDRGALASALHSLQSTLGEVSSFIQANAANLGAGLANVEQATATLAASQSQLAQALEITPLAVQNLGMAVHQTPTGPAIEGRFDPVVNSLPFTNQVCGNIMFRAGTLVEKQGQAPVVDPVCAFGAAVANFRIPPGGATGPVLTFPALMAAEARA